MRHHIAIIAFTFIFSSCADNSKNNLVVFKATAEGLEKSNETISTNTVSLYMALNEKLLQPQSQEKALIWQPKALAFQKLSSNLISYIETLKSDLKREAGFKDEVGNFFYWENNTTAVSRIFDKDKKGNELFERLKEYKRDILEIDTSIKNELKMDIVELAKEFDEDINSQQEFTKTFFSNMPAIAAYAMLNKIENNLKITENRLVTYCYNNSVVSFCGFYIFSPIVSQSSNCVQTGDDIEITAGVGSFSDASQLKFTIDGKLIPLNENGIIVYKFRTPIKAGKYTKPVKMEYIKPDGTRESITKNISYTVIDPNQNPQ